MDLAHRGEDGGAVILDWKTGRRRPQPQGLQLGAYALYASQAWRLEPEQILVVEANLNTDAVGKARITAQHLHQAHEQIAAGIRAMRERLRDPETNQADPEDFPASPEQGRCRRCPFREVCPDYQDALGPSPAQTGTGFAGSG
jgi:hypothetical protein